jgi:hypothetical protein
LAEHQIGISSMIQPETHEGEFVPLVLMVHGATQGRMNAAIERIACLECSKSAPRMIRVETFA